MFAVIWQGTALDELADALVRSDLAQQDEIERRVLQLNARLATDPLDVGESRLGNWRVEFVDFVAILFQVFPADGIVRVVHFWTY